LLHLHLTDNTGKMSAEELTYSDVSSHTTKKDLYVVIHDKIYNDSSFVDEHPGGEEKRSIDL